MTRQLTVTAPSSSLPVVTLVREGSGPLVEGASVVVHADITGIGTRRVDYTLVQAGVVVDVRTAVQQPWSARLTLPTTNGATALELRGVATFDDGRQVAATIALVVVDDLTPPSKPPVALRCAGWSLLRRRTTRSLRSKRSRATRATT